MTKTLTEQWREGTLPDGKYYIKLEPNFTERYDVGYSEGGDFALYNIEDIEEVLTPVPDYTDCKRLMNDSIELVSPKGKVYGYVPDYFEFKRLQEQLADASKTIDYYDKKDFHYTLADGTVMGAEPAHKYKIKWGVK